MVVEATRMKGEGQLVLTGQLGEVMKESATLALSWIRSHADQVYSFKPEIQAFQTHNQAFSSF